MQTRTTLSQKVLLAVQSTPSLRALIALETGVHVNTITNWAKANNPKLCEKSSLRAIKKRVTLPKDEKYTVTEKISEAYLINE